MLAGQIGSTHDAGLPAEVRDSYLGDGAMTATRQGRLEGMPGGQQKQVARLGHSTAQYETPRIEDGGQIGHELAEVAPDDVEALASRGVALLRGQRDLFALNALWGSTTELEKATGQRG